MKRSIFSRKKKIQQEFTENNLYHSILSHGFDAIYAKDLQGKIITWNKAAESMYGYSSKELVGKTVEILMPPGCSDSNKIITKIKQNEIVDNHNTLRKRKDGSIINVVLSASAIKNDKDQICGVSVIARDITKTNQLIHELESLKDRFTSATEAAKIGIWEWDTSTNKLTWDKQMYLIYGVSESDFSPTYTNWKNLIHPDDLPGVEKDIDDALAKKKSYNIAYRSIWPNKSIRQIHAFGKPILNENNEVIKVAGVNWDMSLETESIKSVERFKLAVDAAYDHIIITDAKGRIVYGNSAAEKTTGFTIDEMLGNTPSLWGRQMPKEFYKEMWDTIAVKKKPFVGEIINIRKSGETYIAESHISPILDESGKNIEYYLGIERDITKLKEIDKTKTEFVSLASHQLRTPLSAVNWYAELLLDEDVGALNHEQKSYIHEIYEGNQRMVSLVNALLNISRLELGTFEISPSKINISKIVSEIIKDHKLQIENKKLDLKDSTKKSDIFSNFYADPDLFRIIIQNLISNAVKYTPDKGKIDFEMKNVGENLVVTVSDNGLGIPSHQNDKIFTKLFRADNVQVLEIEGTGLGLYIVKSIVDQVGGDISFVSHLNKGTTFTVKLPLSGMQRKHGTKSLEN